MNEKQPLLKNETSPQNLATQTTQSTAEPNVRIDVTRREAATDENQPLYRAFKDFEKIAEIAEPEKEKLRAAQKLMKELLSAKDSLRLAELFGLIL